MRYSLPPPADRTPTQANFATIASILDYEATMPEQPGTGLAKILIEAGMQPFIDFTPYPGCRLVIANTAKFESLPVLVKSVLQEVFNFVETPDKQMQQLNDAPLQELMVSDR